MYIFAEPVTEEQVAEVQNANQAKAEEFERNVLGRTSSQDDGPKWEDIVAQVEKAMDNDELASAETDEAHSGSENLDNLDVHDHRQLGIEASGAADPGRAMMEEEDAEDDVDGTNVDAEVVAELDEEEAEAGVGANDELEELIEQEDGGVPEVVEAVEQEEAAMAEGPTLVDIEDGAKERLSEETLSVHTAESIDDISTSNEPEQPISTSTRLNGLTLMEALAPSHPSTDNDAQDAHNPENNNNNNNNNNDDGSEFVTEADTSFLDVLSSDASQTATAATATPADDILAMTLTLRNKVNGAYVLRPTDMTAKDKWEIEYSLVEVPLQARARALYHACQVRREKKLASDDVAGGGAAAGAGEEEVISGYVRRLREMSAQGKIWRAERDEADKASGEPVKVLGKQQHHYQQQQQSHDK